MKKDAREKFLKTKVAERQSILEKIKKLNVARSKYIKEIRASKGAKKDAFDEKVLVVLRKQAEKKGIRY
jgi:hypothetical protein